MEESTAPQHDPLALPLFSHARDARWSARHFVTLAGLCGALGTIVFTLHLATLHCPETLDVPGYCVWFANFENVAARPLHCALTAPVCPPVKIHPPIAWYARW